MFSVRFRGDKAEIEAFAAWVNAQGGEVTLQGSKTRAEGFTDVYGIARMPGGPVERAEPGPRSATVHTVAVQGRALPPGRSPRRR